MPLATYQQPAFCLSYHMLSKHQTVKCAEAGWLLCLMTHRIPQSCHWSVQNATVWPSEPSQARNCKWQYVAAEPSARFLQQLLIQVTECAREIWQPAHPGLQRTCRLLITSQVLCPGKASSQPPAWTQNTLWSTASSHPPLQESDRWQQPQCLCSTSNCRSQHLRHC